MDILNKKLYIITDNINNINNLIKNNNLHNKLIFNNEAITIQMLAKEILIKHLASNNQLTNINIINKTTSTNIIFSILKKDKYKFFNINSLSLPTCELLLNDINIIRSNTINTSLLNKKEEDLIDQLNELIDEYEKYLIDNNLYDYILLLKTVINFNDVTLNYHFALIEYLKNKLTNLELKFISKFIHNYSLLPNNNQNNDLDFIACYGKYTETQYILNDIINKNIPLGDVAIYYSNNNYLPYLQYLLNYYHFSYSVINGKPLLDNYLIGLLTNILNWANNNYDLSYLESYISNQNIYDFLMECNISLSLDRYKLFVDNMKNHREDFLSKLKIYDYYFNPIIDNIDKYLDLISSLINIFSSTTNINLKDLFINLLNLKYKDKTILESFNNIDIQYINDLINSLNYLPNIDTLKEAIDILLNEINSLNVKEQELENAISIYNLNNINFTTKKHVYFIGLDYKSFEPKTTNSPFLNDDLLSKFFDIKNYDGYIPLCKNKPFEKNNNFEYLLKSFNQENKISLIRSYFDPLSQIKNPPSIIYNKLLNKDEIIIKEYYNSPKLTNNIYTFNFEKEFNLTEHHNKLPFADITKDELGNIIKIKINKALSPSNYENLIKCPLKFVYYSYDEEKEINSSNGWLDNLKKGSFYHKVLELYCNKYLLNKKPNEISLDLYDYKNIINEVKEIYELFIYSPNENVKEYELSQIEKNIESYLNKLHKDLINNHYMVVACEKKLDNDITISIDENGNLYNKDSSKIEIVLTFSKSSTIDRIDYKLDENNKIISTRIIDYKTTSNKKNLNGKQYIIYPLLLGFKYATENENYEFDYELLITKETISKPKETFKKEEIDTIIEFMANDNITKSDCDMCQKNYICAKKLNIIK